MQDSGSWAVSKVTARDQGHYKGPSGAFVTYCNISCFFFFFFFFNFTNYFIQVNSKTRGTDRVDPDEVAQCEPPHLDLFYLQM